MNEKDSDSESQEEVSSEEEEEKDIDKDDSDGALSNVNDDKDDSVNDEDIANKSLDSIGQGDIQHQIVDI